MKKNLFFALLACIAIAHGMNFDIEEEQAKEARRLFNAVKYVLSLDWCENQLGMMAQLANEHLNEQALTTRCKEIGIHCGEHTGVIAQATCLTSIFCCSVTTCAYSPCLGACGCTSCALVARKLYATHNKVMKKYGLAKKTE